MGCVVATILLFGWHELNKASATNLRDFLTEVSHHEELPCLIGFYLPQTVHTDKGMYTLGQVQVTRDIHPLSRCILHIPPISTKFINSPNFCKIYKFPHSTFIQFTFFVLNLRFIASPLFWPWCIYASCFTCTGRPWIFWLSKTTPLVLESLSCNSFIFWRTKWFLKQCMW